MDYNMKQLVKCEFELDEDIQKNFGVDLYYSSSHNHMLKVIGNEDEFDEITFRVNDNILISYDFNTKNYDMNGVYENKKITKAELTELVSDFYETDIITLEVII